MKKKDLKPLPIIMGVIFAAAGLSYLFWGLDILPDGNLAIVGYLDDAGVMIALWILFRRFTAKMK